MKTNSLQAIHTPAVVNCPSPPVPPPDPAVYRKLYAEILNLRDAMDRVTDAVRKLNPNLEPISFDNERAEHILKWLCQRFTVRCSVLFSKNRKANIARVRQLGYMLVRELCPNLSLAAIGSIFGGRDHGTISHGITTLAGIASVDQKERQFQDALRRDCETFLRQIHQLHDRS